MKKYIILLMTGIAAMLASCSQNEEPLAAGDRLQSVTFHLAADGSDLQTRAASTVAINRYVMEVYDQDGNTPVNVFGETHRKEQTTPSFTFVLDRTKTYRCLFWADRAAADIYDVSNLKAVTLKQNQKAIESSFYAAKTVSGNATVYAVTLSRAVAKIRLGEKDCIKGGSTLVATYQANTTFNVMDGALGQPADCTVTFDIATEITGTADVPTQVGEPFYMLAPDDESNVTTFKFQLNDEPEKTVDNVPVRANYSVFIRGEFSNLTEKAFAVTAEDGWATPETDMPLDPGYTLSTDADGKKTYNVYNATGLLAWNEALATDATINLTLTKDIVMPAVAPGAGGNWTCADIIYTGTIEGNGHKIKGLVVDDITTDYVGFVKRLGPNGHIKNLGLTDGSIKGRLYVGGLAGQNAGKIENCHNANSVHASRVRVGGITGHCYRGTIVACYNTGAISSGAPSGYSYAGGIAGGTEVSSNIYVCYNTGSISGCKSIGGVVGNGSGDADYLMLCYNTGTVTSTADPLENVGAVAGTCKQYAFNNGQIGYNTYGGNSGLNAIGNLDTDNTVPGNYSVLYSTEPEPSAARTAAGWQWVNPGDNTTPPTRFEKIATE